MTPTGPKPTPSALTPDGPGPQEPRPAPAATLAPPTTLTGLALDEWNRVAPELDRLGLLTRVDLTVLAFYCITYARWQESEDTIAKQGVLVKTKSGNVIQHPALGVANTAMKLCHKFAAEFGFTPSSRTRIKVEPKEEADGLAMP